MNRIVTRSLRYEPPELWNKLALFLDENETDTFPPLNELEKQLKEDPSDTTLPNSQLIVPQKSFVFKDGERHELRLLILGNNLSSSKKLALVFVFTESSVVITGVKVL